MHVQHEVVEVCALQLQSQQQFLFVFFCQMLMFTVPLKLAYIPKLEVMFVHFLAERKKHQTACDCAPCKVLDLCRSAGDEAVMKIECLSSMCDH